MLKRIKMPKHKSGLNTLELFVIVMAVMFTIAYSTHTGNGSTEAISNINEKPSKSLIQPRNCVGGSDVPDTIKKPSMTLTERYNELRGISAIPNTIRKPQSIETQMYGDCN